VGIGLGLGLIFRVSSVTAYSLFHISIFARWLCRKCWFCGSI